MHYRKLALKATRHVGVPRRVGTVWMFNCLMPRADEAWPVGLLSAEPSEPGGCMSRTIESSAAASVRHPVRSVMRYGTVLLCLLCGCAGLPPNTGRLLTYAMRNTDDTLLGQAVSVR